MRASIPAAVRWERVSNTHSDPAPCQLARRNRLDPPLPLFGNLSITVRSDDQKLLICIEPSDCQDCTQCQNLKNAEGGSKRLLPDKLSFDKKPPSLAVFFACQVSNSDNGDP